MNCYYHPTTTVVATCPDCRKGLCKSCCDKYSLPICTACAGRRFSAEKNEILTGFAWMIGMGIAGVLLFNNSYVGKICQQNPFLGGTVFNITVFNIILFYYSVAIVAGWKTLNKLTSNYFLFLPLIGWVVYLIIKLYVAMLIGIFVAPFRIAKDIRRLTVLNNIGKL